jgi:ribosome-associated protein
LGHHPPPRSSSALIVRGGSSTRRALGCPLTGSYWAATDPAAEPRLAPAAGTSFSFARSGGAGGQNVNKLNTKAVCRFDINGSPFPEAVRARLRVSGGATSSGELVVAADGQRTQAANRKEALEKLAARVAAAWRPPKQRRMREGLSAKGKRARRDEKSKNAQKKQARRRPTLLDFAPQRARVRALGTAAAAAAAAALHAPRPAHAFTALGLAAKQRQRDQAACFEALECAEPVPAYDIQCARDDAECLQRRQRLARQEIKAFLAEPGGFVGVAAILLLGSGSRLLRALSRRDGE